MNYDESVSFMSGLLQFGIRLDRARFVALLARLGNPHKKLKCVHVAGTNGKGSTTTLIASVLRAAGYTVGAYLSPYVFDLRERIQINGVLIERNDFARWVTTIRPHIDEIAQTDLGQTTEFELKTAVAFGYFAERGVDFAVVEVGIGGRLDATNVIDPPLVAVITSIGLDHQKLLGDTLGQIAGEKAGILKKGTLACVSAVPAGEALDVIAATANARGVALRRVGPAGAGAADFYATYQADDKHPGRVNLVVPGGGLDHLALRLRGPFQWANAAAAAAAVAVLEEHAVITLASGARRAGLETATLPGRFQIARDENNRALVLDGAHNADGARVLASALRAEFPGKRFRFVVGMRQNHDAGPFLDQIVPLAPAQIIATAPHFKPQPATAIAAAAFARGLSAQVIAPAARAIKESWEAAGSGEVVVVTGSFYTVGETPPGLR